MATIKAYTDIEQSRKLAEILPLESADMLWEQHGAEPYVTIKPWTTIGKSIGCHCLSCWSLAALLGVLPKIGAEEPMIRKLYYASKPKERYICEYNIANITSEYDNPVDACYEMIIKLHEQMIYDFNNS